MHPLVAAEVALGSLHNRRRKLAVLDALWQVNVAEIERKSMRCGASSSLTLSTPGVWE